MKQILAFTLLFISIIFIAYNIVNIKKEDTVNKAPPTHKEQLENQQLEEMMGISAQQEERVKIPTH